MFQKKVEKKIYSKNVNLFKMQNYTLWLRKTNMLNSALKILTGIDFMQKSMTILPRFEKLERKSTKLTFPFQVYFTRCDYFHP